MFTPSIIALEGGEGAGKDTQIDRLKATLDPAKFVFTREPGGTGIGEEIRTLLLRNRADEMFPEAELLLFLAARAQLMQQVIRPALEAGKTVITNRFGLSTIAYQIYGRERLHLLPFLQAVSREVVEVSVQVHYILLDIDPEIGRERVQQRGEMSRFDADTIAFHKRVREGYLAHYQDQNNGAVLIDASKSEDAVSYHIRRRLGNLGIVSSF